MNEEEKGDMIHEISSVMIKALQELKAPPALMLAAADYMVATLSAAANYSIVKLLEKGVDAAPSVKGFRDARRAASIHSDKALAKTGKITYVDLEYNVNLFDNGR